MKYCFSIVLALTSFTYALGQPLPRLTVITPPGGQAGTTVQITLAGADLEEITSLMIAPEGLAAERVPNPAKKGEFLPNTFAIKIPKETVPGNYDLRAVGAWGITNPRTFVVGELTEVQEKEPNNDVPQAQQVQLNSTINGVIQSPADVDYYAVTCKAGESVVVQVAAESIDSRLEPDLRVFNKSGKLITANRPRAEPDGFCHFIATEADVYYIRLCSHAYVEGNAESFYRLSISTRPWIDAIYPNIVEPGKADSVMLWGRNLVGATLDPQFKINHQPLQRLAVTLAPPTENHALQQLVNCPWTTPGHAGLDAFYYRVKNPSGWSNSVPVTYAHGPVILENGEHGSAAKAQQVPIPCEIVGRIDHPNDRDWYSFTARAGEVISLEGFAERLDIPIDLYFELRRQDGSMVGEYNQNTDQSLYHRFFARTDDPAVRVTIPADGKYLLMVSSRDATLRGNPKLIYQVSLHKPRPDFRAVAVDAHPQNPGTLRLVPGERQHLDVVLFRREGFAGPVTLSVEGLPAGVTCTSSTVPANAATGALVLTANDKATEFNGLIKIMATATIEGQTVTREVRSGCLVWPNPNEQNNGPGISRWCRTTPLAVRTGKPAFRITPVSESLALPLSSGQGIKFKVERLWPDAKQPILLSAVHLPAGVTFNNNQPFTLPPDKNDAEIRLQIQGNSTVEQFPLVIRGVTQTPFAKDPKAKQKPNIQVAETAGSMNVIVYRKVVDVALTQPAVDTKQGSDATITLKLTRLHGYQGTIAVQAQGLPNGVGLATVTIPEKAVEGKLVLKVNKNAAPVKAANITLRCTGVANGISLTTDAKLALTVQKVEAEKTTPAKSK